jgi:hypothetical protein
MQRWHHGLPLDQHMTASLPLGSETRALETLAAPRARRDLNADTIREMHRAFREGGREAILKVMKRQPAIFLKLLVLLVPRELEVTRTPALGVSRTAVMGRHPKTFA